MKIQRTSVEVSAVGIATQWLKLDYWEHPFDVSLLIDMSSSFGGTVALDYIIDTSQQDTSRLAMASQSGTTVTIIDQSNYTVGNSPNVAAGPMVKVGDMVTVSGTPAGVSDGTFSVASLDGNYEFTYASTAPATWGPINVQIITGRVIGSDGSYNDMVIKNAPNYGYWYGASAAASNNPFYAAGTVSARTSFELVSPVWAVRARCSTYSATGFLSLVTMQGGK